MAVFRDQPYGNARFVVQVDGVPAQAFSEVHLPEFSDEVVEFREGSDPEGASRKVPGRPRFGTLLLRRGFRGSLELYEWWRQATAGEASGRRNVRVQLLDEGAANVVAEWELRGAWPARYYLSALVAQGGDVLVENAEVACDRVEMR
jgi:phage tail-like protein